MRKDRHIDPAAESASDDLDLVSTEAMEGDDPTRSRKRRVRRKRKAERAEESEFEAAAKSETPTQRDWNAIVEGTSPGTDDGWLEWSAENEPDPVSPAPETAPAAAGENGSGEETVARWETVTEPVDDAAAAGGEGADTDAAAGDSPLRYRTTPSWPPPARRRFFTRGLCALILIVVVALLLTNGQIGRPDSADRKAAAVQNRPALRTDPASVPADWIVYRHPSAGYGISHPPGWSVRQEGSTVHIRDPQTGAELRVEHRKGKGATEPEAVWTEMERTMTGRFPDYQRLQLAPASYLGHKAALWEFLHTEGDGRRLHSADLGLVTDEERLSLYFQAPVAQWEELLPAFQGFLSSFRTPK